jgi:hypothetical protein
VGYLAAADTEVTGIAESTTADETGAVRGTIRLWGTPVREDPAAQARERR